MPRRFENISTGELAMQLRNWEPSLRNPVYKVSVALWKAHEFGRVPEIEPEILTDALSELREFRVNLCEDLASEFRVNLCEDLANELEARYGELVCSKP